MVRRRLTGYVRPGMHRWRVAGSYISKHGGLYGIHVCQVCGVRVDTCAPFPKRACRELWDGKVMRARQERPACLTPAVHGVQ